MSVAAPRVVANESASVVRVSGIAPWRSNETRCLLLDGLTCANYVQKNVVGTEGGKTAVLR